MDYHKKSAVIGFLLAMLLPAAGQEHAAEVFIISGTVKNSSFGKIYLAGFYGDRFILKDSVESGTGSFYFMVDGSEPAGVCRLLFNQVAGGTLSGNRFVEFIFNREDVEIVVGPGRDDIGISGESPENRVYSEFLDYEIGYEERIMELYDDLAQPGRAEAYNLLQRRRSAYIDSVTVIYPDLFASRLIRAFRSPFVPGSMSHRERVDTLRVCFFNHAAIDDPSLMYAPVYTFRILDFLSLFLDEHLPEEEQQQQYRDAVDRIMGNTSMDPELRSFVVEFLMEGFGMLGMDLIGLHLAENYLDETCPSDTGEVIRSRMECFRKLAEGEEAPDFVIRDLEGVNHHLAGMDHDLVLVLFWSSACGHCRDLMPELNRWYLHEKDVDLEVLSISIDPEETSFREYMKGLDPGWITARDPLGWIGKIATGYCIYATPSMFLLDRDRRILAKPLNFRQLLKEIQQER